MISLTKEDKEELHGLLDEMRKAVVVDLTNSRLDGIVAGLEMALKWHKMSEADGDLLTSMLKIGIESTKELKKAHSNETA